MTTTYCTDDDIVAEWPYAVDDLNGGAASFDAVRVLVKSEIDDTLWRRDEPIDPSELEDTTELMRCEVCGVLSKLFQRAASTQGDFYLSQWEYYRKEFSEELAKPVTVGGEVRRRGRCIRMIRC